ncbi:MAG: excinuclease ABC subunit UvrC, partial [Nitrospirota bacterium]
MAAQAAKQQKPRKKKSPKKRPRLSEKVSSSPRKPGVYIFTGPGERVLYVGKAKNLRSRISSYFQKAGDLDPRKQAMVRDIKDLNYIVTDNELEALALEANLIKQYKPRFNVILRDDKSYPYLKLTVNEEWPRLEVVRKVRRDGAMYFGPYVPSSSMREALDFIRRNFGVRPCRYRLDRPMRPCIQYQMGRCPAPCAPGKISREDYMREVQDVVMFLKGKKRDLLDELRAKMARYSGEERYEDAARIRDRMEALGRAWESQKVISPELGDLDVIGCHTNGDAAFQVFFVRNGVMVGAREFYLRDAGVISPGELYHSF